jgi:hypothetical protein
MIIHDFHLVSISFAPAKTYPPLVIYPDAMLSFASALQCFKAIAGWHGHVPQFRGGVQCQQLAPGAALNIRRQTPGHFRSEDPFGFRARKTDNH